MCCTIFCFIFFYKIRMRVMPTIHLQGMVAAIMIVVVMVIILINYMSCCRNAFKFKLEKNRKRNNDVGMVCRRQQLPISWNLLLIGRAYTFVCCWAACGSLLLLLLVIILICKRLLHLSFSDRNDYRRNDRRWEIALCLIL